MNGRKIMINLLHVDDDKFSFELLEAQIARLDPTIRITWKESVDEALLSLENNQYECIVSDYQMPNKTGLDFLAYVRKHFLKVPFIFHTGQGSEKVAAEALRLGADDYFSKETEFASYQRLLNSIQKNVSRYSVITENEKNALLLKRNEQRLSRLIYSFPGGLYSLNSEFQREYSNQLVESWFEFKEVSNQRFCQECPFSDLLECNDCAIYSCHTTKSEQSTVLEDTLAATNRTFEIKATPVYQQGNPMEILVVIRDLTQLISMTKKALEHEQRFNLLAEATLEGIIIHDDGIIKFMNEKLANMLGYSPEELIGTSGLELMHPDWFDTAVEKIRTKYTKPYRAALRSRAGETIWVRIQGREIPFEGKNVRVSAIKRLGESEF